MLFSVITVCFNAINEIDRTLQSVLEQTYDNYEYIIIDGGSNDGTLSVIQEYLPRFADKNISVDITSESDEGIADAFNKGIRKAHGYYTVIVNAGDCLQPDALEYVSKQKESDVIYGNIVWHDVKQNTNRVRKSSPNLNNLIFDMVIMHPSTFVRKEAYDKIGYFDTSFKYCMDQELLVRMQQAGLKFTYVDKELAVMDSGGVSDSNLGVVLKESARIPAMYGKPRLLIEIHRVKKTVRTKLAHAYYRLHP